MEWILNRHFWIVHLALVGLFALAAASVVTRVLGSRWEVNTQQVEHPIRRSTQSLKQPKRQRSDYSVILDRNIFQAVVKETSPQKRAQSEKPITADQVKDLAKTSLDVRLRGTAVRDGGASFAVVEDKRARKEDLYRVGDMILGEAKVIQILEDRVVVLRDGKKESLELFVEEGEKKKPPSTTASSKRPPTVLGSGVRRVGSNRWSVSREAIESAKGNLSQLMTQVRVTPNFTEGKPDGFKLLSIKRGSIFDRLGLRNGDVVRGINDVPLDSPEKALEVYGQLESGQSVRVDVVRRGRQQTFTYELK